MVNFFQLAAFFRLSLRVEYDFRVEINERDNTEHGNDVWGVDARQC